MNRCQDNLGAIAIDEQTIAFRMTLLTKAESENLIHACGELGVDPSSEHFVKRTKNIAYVMCLNKKWFQMRADYFIQPQRYNDFSGGYKRRYREMPATFIASKAVQKVLSSFQESCKIPEGELILVQVQESHIERHDESRCLTGQGIHSDGADKAIIVCLKRDNIEGAENAIFQDLDGRHPIISPHVLDEGDALVWEDNKSFHHVSSASVSDLGENGKRTILIAHYPAIHYLDGSYNPNNTLGSNVVEVSQRLRLHCKV